MGHGLNDDDAADPTMEEVECVERDAEELNKGVISGRKDE